MDRDPNTEHKCNAWPSLSYPCDRQTDRYTYITYTEHRVGRGRGAVRSVHGYASLCTPCASDRCVRLRPSPSVRLRPSPSISVRPSPSVSVRLRPLSTTTTSQGSCAGCAACGAGHQRDVPKVHVVRQCIKALAYSAQAAPARKCRRAQRPRTTDKQSLCSTALERAGRRSRRGAGVILARHQPRNQAGDSTRDLQE